MNVIHRRIGTGGALTRAPQPVCIKARAVLCLKACAAGEDGAVMVYEDYIAAVQDRFPEIEFLGLPEIEEEEWEE